MIVSATQRPRLYDFRSAISFAAAPVDAFCMARSARMRPCHLSRSQGKCCRLYMFIGVLAIALTGTRTASSNERPGRRVAAINHALCGPICVQKILRHYGKKVDLIEIAQRIRPEGGIGARMGALKEALEKHGVHTYAIKLDSLSQLNWPGPVLVHLARGDSGHFVVWNEGADGTTSISEQPVSFGSVPLEALDAQFSGYALFTSAQPIEHDPVQPLTLKVGAIWGLTVVVLLASFFTWLGQRCKIH